jgi:hypothetical protein
MARPPLNAFRVPWGANDPCPCKSNMPYGQCCASPLDHAPIGKTRALAPPLPRTSYCHPKCYLGFTDDCSSKISREHYVSKVVLQQYKNLTISGMPWQTEGQATGVNSNSLAANILCDRHNSLLSPLDAIGGHSLEAIHHAVQHAMKRSVSRQSAYFLIDGEAFERWGMKAMLGLLHAKVARQNGVALLGEHTFLTTTIMQGLLGGRIARPSGLRVRGMPNALVIDDALNMAPLTNSKGKNLNGLILQIRGISFEFLFDVEGADSAAINDKTFYRPRIVDVIGPRRTARIFLSWSTERNEARRIAVEIGR